MLDIFPKISDSIKNKDENCIMRLLYNELKQEPKNNNFPIDYAILLMEENKTYYIKYIRFCYKDLENISKDIFKKEKINICFMEWYEQCQNNIEFCSKVNNNLCHKISNLNNTKIDNLLLEIKKLKLSQNGNCDCYIDLHTNCEMVSIKLFEKYNYFFTTICFEEKYKPIIDLINYITDVVDVKLSMKFETCNKEEFFRQELGKKNQKLSDLK